MSSSRGGVVAHILFTILQLKIIKRMESISQRKFLVKFARATSLVNVSAF